MILLVGPSASGKTEIAKELFNLYRIKKVITHTTRDMRINEVKDVDYHFVTVEEFLNLEKEDYFVETTFYNNNYYGTSKKELGDDKVLVVDPNGKQAFMNLKDPHIIIFYIEANKDLRKQRMIERGDNENCIKERLKKDCVCFNESAKKGCHFIINNENKTLREVSEEIYYKYLSKIR